MAPPPPPPIGSPSRFDSPAFVAAFLVACIILFVAAAGLGIVATGATAPETAVERACS